MKARWKKKKSSMSGIIAMAEIVAQHPAQAGEPEYAGMPCGFRVERGWEGVCVARRPGGGSFTAAPTLKVRLVAKGE